jgi:hypothetical protein
MAKEHVTLKNIMLHWFTYHPWLKIIALALAILTWFYVRGEMDRFTLFR